MTFFNIPRENFLVAWCGVHKTAWKLRVDFVCAWDEILQTKAVCHTFMFEHDEQNLWVKVECNLSALRMLGNGHTSLNNMQTSTHIVHLIVSSEVLQFNLNRNLIASIIENVVKESCNILPKTFRNGFEFISHHQNVHFEDLIAHLHLHT